MSLLVPDIGLLFWMTLSFGIVLLVLIKFGFPVILKAVDKRRSYIVESLDAARQAEEKLAGINRQAQAVMDSAQAERNALIKQARTHGEEIVEKAKSDAQKEAQLVIKKSHSEAEEMKRKAMDEVMDRIAGISVSIAGKVLGEQLETTEGQNQLIDRLLKEEITDGK